MRHGSTLLMLLSAGILLASQSSSRGDDHLLRGSWKVTRAERDGKPNPSEVGSILTFSDGKLSIQSPEGRMVQFRYKLNSLPTPNHIDVIMERSGQEFVLQGIFKVEGDSFILCLSNPIAERPAEFATKPGNQHSLTFHERVK